MELEFHIYSFMFVTEVGGLYPQAPSRCVRCWILFFVVLQIYEMIIGLFADLVLLFMLL